MVFCAGRGKASILRSCLRAVGKIQHELPGELLLLMPWLCFFSVKMYFISFSVLTLSLLILLLNSHPTFTPALYSFLVILPLYYLIYCTLILSPLHPFPASILILSPSRPHPTSTSIHIPTPFHASPHFHFQLHPISFPLLISYTVPSSMSYILIFFIFFLPSHNSLSSVSYLLSHPEPWCCTD
jgi:hypothetical protein